MSNPLPPCMATMSRIAARIADTAWQALLFLMLGMLALPFLDRGPHRHPWAPSRRVFTLAFLAVAAMLGAASVPATIVNWGGDDPVGRGVIAHHHGWQPQPASRQQVEHRQ